MKWLNVYICAGVGYWYMSDWVFNVKFWCYIVFVWRCIHMYANASSFCRNTTWLPLPVLRMRLQLFCNKITRVQGNPYSFFCTALTQIAIISLSLQSFRFLILTISIITIFLFIKALGYHCELSAVYYSGQCYQISTIAQWFFNKPLFPIRNLVQIVVK